MPDIRFIFDTVCLSNFALAGALDLIVRRYAGRAVITSEVHDELLVGMTEGHAKLETIEGLLVEETLKVLSLQRDEYPLYKKLLRILGKGEASCIAVAFQRSMVFVSDDKAARTVAREMNIKVTGTVGILKAAVADRQITLAQADDRLGAMIDAGFYSPVNSLSQIE